MGLVLLAGILLVGLGGAVVVVILTWTDPPPGAEGDDGSDDDGGGGSRRHPPRPSPCPPDPEWWPEFERDFAAYAARSLTDRPPARR